MNSSPQHNQDLADQAITDVGILIDHLHRRGWIRLQPGERPHNRGDISSIMRQPGGPDDLCRSTLPSSTPRYHVVQAQFATRILRQTNDAFSCLGFELWYRIELTPEAREASLAAAACGRRPS